jgi:hypothetical protein
MKDVRLQTEQEFYALGLQLSQKDFEEGAFGNAVKSPLEGTEIGLSVNVSPVPGPGREMRFDVQLVTQDLFLLREKDHYVGKVSVVFAMDDEQATRPIPLNLNFSVQQYQAALPGTISFRQAIQIPLEVQKVRAIVVDSERRAVGSVSIPLNVVGR